MQGARQLPGKHTGRNVAGLVMEAACVVAWSTSNTDKILVELASSCKALGFYEIKAFGWRTVPTKIDALYCTNTLWA